MVMVVGGIIRTRYHHVLLGRGDNNGGKERRWCDAILSPRTFITAAAVEVLRLIRNKRGGWRQ